MKQSLTSLCTKFSLNHASSTECIRFYEILSNVSVSQNSFDIIKLFPLIE